MPGENKPSPNDQRSTVKNPNSDSSKKDRDNRSDQLNTERVEETKGRGSKR